MTTMKDLFEEVGEGSEHDACEKCHFCIACGDCKNYHDWKEKLINPKDGVPIPSKQKEAIFSKHLGNTLTADEMMIDEDPNEKVEYID